MEHTSEKISPYYTVRVTSVKQETADVKTFTLERADGQPIVYAAGQFLTFVFNNHGKEERRSYSISSSPSTDSAVTITLKRVENGAYSRKLIDLTREGDTLITTGAAGLFTLPEDITAYKQLFFLAAGIGITPILSLIKTVLHEHPTVHVVLIYSNSNRDSAVFIDELRRLANSYPRTFRIELLYSTAFNLSRARLSKWLLPKLLKEYSQAAKDDILFYLCGPFSYMRMVWITLEELSIPATHIRKENFDTQRAAPKSKPPDTVPHVVQLHHAGQQHNLKVQYPQTILQAAKQAGIALPYSCETGRCGSCVALCTQGKVWLSYNEVLTEKDLQAGKVLTCTGYPVGGDIILEA